MHPTNASQSDRCFLFSLKGFQVALVWSARTDPQKGCTLLNVPFCLVYRTSSCTRRTPTFSASFLAPRSYQSNKNSFSRRIYETRPFFCLFLRPKSASKTRDGIRCIFLSLEPQAQNLCSQDPCTRQKEEHDAGRYLKRRVMQTKEGAPFPTKNSKEASLCQVPATPQCTCHMYQVRSNLIRASE